MKASLSESFFLFLLMTSVCERKDRKCFEITQFAFLIASNPLNPLKLGKLPFLRPQEALKKLNFSGEFYSKSITFIVKFYVGEVHRECLILNKGFRDSKKIVVVVCVFNSKNEKKREKSLSSNKFQNEL